MDEIVDLENAMNDYFVEQVGESHLGFTFPHKETTPDGKGMRDLLYGAYNSLTKEQKKVFREQYGSVDELINKAMENYRKSLNSDLPNTVEDM